MKQAEEILDIEEDSTMMFEHEEDFSPNLFPIKWIADGAESFEEVVTILQSLVLEIEALTEEGYYLSEPVDGGIIYYERA